MLALRFVMNRKLNYFKIKDALTNKSVLYRPNRGLNLGFGASYKWFALDLVFNTSVWQDVQLYDSRSFDLQGRFYTNKHFLEAKLQYYGGYSLDRVNGSSVHKNELIREDIRSLSMGIQYLFAFNYEKFSFKAPFVLSEVQRKSAGSVIAGVGFNTFMINGDSTIVPSAEHDNMNSKLLYDDLLVLDLSLKLGYMYTHVHDENYFLSVGAIPGIGYSVGDYRVDSRTKMIPKLSWNMKGLVTLGYNDAFMFYGIQYIVDIHSLKQDYMARTVMGTGILSLMVGYRFDMKKYDRPIGRASE